MKYAKEVIELMAAYPGREFRMSEIVRYVSGGRKQIEQKERTRIRVGASVVVRTLAENGSVIIRPSRKSRGGFALYRWR